ncbi:MAG: leucine-rich repeat domain-containing protein [Spirochaetaceae bacterium]|jgi:hypothetical protein|nr:leucine-rich repeat domain-containing protein [Spirochaetaceae bacterium]
MNEKKSGRVNLETTLISTRSGMKAISFISVLFLFLPVSLVFGQSESNFEVSINLNGDGVVIDRYLADEKEVLIPSSFEGFPVREIGRRAFQMKYLNSVSIPEGVTIIGDEAFIGCTNLVSIEMPSTITVISSTAFFMCHNLPLATQAHLRKLGYEGKF